MTETAVTGAVATTRRRFCRNVGLGLAGVLMAPTAIARPALAGPRTRDLSFQHLHTGEHLHVNYVEGGEVMPEALDRINHVLRDHYDGTVHPIDPDLLDILHAVRLETGTSLPFLVISGYRSPATNKMLRKRGSGVSKNSLHMQGRAIDIRLPDVDTADLRDAGLAVALGGVGYYKSSNFVHLDTGRVRRWSRP